MENVNNNSCPNVQGVENRKEVKGESTTSDTNTSKQSNVITRRAAALAARACVHLNRDSKGGNSSLSKCYVSLEKLPRNGRGKSVRVHENHSSSTRKKFRPSNWQQQSDKESASSSTTSTPETSENNESNNNSLFSGLNTTEFTKLPENLIESPDSKDSNIKVASADVPILDESATSESAQTNNLNCNFSVVPEETEVFKAGSMAKLLETTTSRLAKRNLLGESRDSFLPTSNSECAIVRVEPNGSLTSIVVPISGDGINAFEFSYLMHRVHSKASHEDTRVLLLDCRDSNSFNFTRRMAFSPCVNVNISRNGLAAGGFPSKASVIKFFHTEKCFKLLRYLGSPDHYTNIIVMDEKSTTKESSVTVKSVIAAINTWTMNTGTTVKLLQGGIQTMHKAYPNKITVYKTRQLAEEMEGLWTEQGEPTLPTKAEQEMAKYLMEYDNAMTSAVLIIDLKKQLTSLQAIRTTLIQEQESKLLFDLRSQFPDVVKCTSCSKVFTGEIIQCVQGHCICHLCCGKISVCPECKISYYSVGISIGKVRNRGLEGLMKNMLRAKCPCGERVKSADVISHVKQCVNGKLKIDSVELIEGELDCAQAEIANEIARLDGFNKAIVNSEYTWCITKGNTDRFSQISPNERKNFMDKIGQKQAFLSSLKVQLFSFALFDEEYSQNQDDREQVIRKNTSDKK